MSEDPDVEFERFWEKEQIENELNLEREHVEELDRRGDEPDR